MHFLIIFVIYFPYISGQNLILTQSQINSFLEKQGCNESGWYASDDYDSCVRFQYGAAINNKLCTPWTENVCPEGIYTSSMCVEYNCPDEMPPKLETLIKSDYPDSFKTFKKDSKDNSDSGEENDSNNDKGNERKSYVKKSKPIHRTKSDEKKDDAASITIPTLEIREFWLILLVALCGTLAGTTIIFLATSVYCCCRARRFKVRIPYRHQNIEIKTSQSKRPFIQKLFFNMKRTKQSDETNDLERKSSAKEEDLEMSIRTAPKNKSSTIPYKTALPVEKTLPFHLKSDIANSEIYSHPTRTSYISETATLPRQPSLFSWGSPSIAQPNTPSVFTFPTSPFNQAQTQQHFFQTSQFPYHPAQMPAQLAPVPAPLQIQTPQIPILQTQIPTRVPTRQDQIQNYQGARHAVQVHEVPKAKKKSSKENEDKKRKKKKSKEEEEKKNESANESPHESSIQQEINQLGARPKVRIKKNSNASSSE